MNIAVMKSDARMIRLAELLNNDGFDAKLFSPDEVPAAAAFGGVIVLPVKNMEPEQFNGYLSAGQILVTGNDFLSRDDFSILNAIPTVEGALQLAMENTSHTIHGSRCCVIGFGRIGKILAEKLYHLGAEVTVSVRKAGDFAWLRALGYEAVNTTRLDGKLNKMDIIFNTVPRMVLPFTRLEELKRSCLVIDLASAPGGVDFIAAEKLSIKALWALSLPGKVAPESAARYMRDTLITILHEKEVRI